MWLAEAGVGTEAHAGLLDDTERARRAALLHDGDRARFTTGAALIRLLVGGHTGTAPRAVRVDRHCRDCALPHGRPQLPGSGLHISLSHSGRLVALAISHQAPVGIDVEAKRPRDIDGLWRMILAPGEEPSTEDGFYTTWCRKESVVKATGDGLRTPMSRVQVSAPAEAPVLLSYQGRVPAAAMRDFVPAPGYAGAVTVLAAGTLDLEVRAVEAPLVP